LAATALYFAALPLNLGTPDEAHGLLAARRVFDGEVMYRDVFELTTPGWIMLMAGLFHVFGPTLATARLTVAVLHGATVLLLFLTCRRLGVRRGLAAACGIAYLVICQPMFPIASYHWLATFLCVLLLALAVHAAPTPRSAWVLGICVGLLIAVHQQRGLSMGLGAGAVLAVQPFLDRGAGPISAHRRAWRLLAAFTAGVALVVAALLIALVRAAGIRPVWNALVIVPLVNYAGHISTSWGRDVAARSPGSGLLKYLPATIPVTALPLLALARRERSAERVRVVGVLTLLCGAALLSILYYPDSIHLAFVTPLFLVAWADAIERGARLLPAAVARPLAGGLAAAVLLAGGVQLALTLRTARARHHVACETSFGRVDRPGACPPLWAQVRQLVAETPSRALYVYPMAMYLHLLSGAHNPVRFAFIAPGYTAADQLDEIVATLAARRPPYVVVNHHFARATDRVARFLREHYQPAPELPPLVWRLKAGEGRATEAPEGAAVTGAAPPNP
jgi:hypothetical protein